VPFASAFETDQLPTLALGLIPTAARPAHHLAAFRAWAPLEVSVFADLDILCDSLIGLRDLLGTKPLNMIGLEALFALVLHARDIHGLAIDYAKLQVVPRAV
jgi:hypothetical protein